MVKIKKMIKRLSLLLTIYASRFAIYISHLKICNSPFPSLNLKLSTLNPFLLSCLLRFSLASSPSRFMFKRSAEDSRPYSSQVKASGLLLTAYRLPARWGQRALQFTPYSLLLTPYSSLLTLF